MILTSLKDVIGLYLGINDIANVAHIQTTEIFTWFFPHPLLDKELIKRKRAAASRHNTPKIPQKQYSIFPRVDADFG
jgi:hypothetical protein